MRGSSNPNVKMNQFILILTNPLLMIYTDLFRSPDSTSKLQQLLLVSLETGK